MLKSGYKWQIFLSIMVCIFISSSSISINASISYNFPKLDPLFEEDLTGIMIDYNSNIPGNEGITILEDIIGNLELAPENDSDPKKDNIITMIQNNVKGFKSLVFVINKIKRTEEIPFLDPFEWESIVPYIKYIHQYSLDSGEDVLLSTDFLGLALKINGTGFDPTEYQLGYANVPIDLLEFLLNNLQVGKTIHDGISDRISGSYSPRASNVTINVEETMQETVVSVTFENISYIFQSSKIDLHEISRTELSKKYLIVQFDKISFDIRLRKYSSGSNKGIETFTQVTIGDVTNLIINEHLPSEEAWLFSSEYRIDGKFREIVSVNDTFSWYRESDIQKRMGLFNMIDISIITSQSLAILNDTTSMPHELYLDEELREHPEIMQQSFNVTNSITSYYNDKAILTSIVKGFNFAQLRDNDIMPIRTRLMALNREKGFSGNLLFLEETTLVRDLVSESFKRFIGNTNVTVIGNDQFYRMAGLYLSTSEYVREDRISGWKGKQSKVNFIQIGVSESKEVSIEKLNEITIFNSFSFHLLLILVISLRRMKYRKQR